MRLGLVNTQSCARTLKKDFLGRVNTIKRIGDERKVDKEGEHHIKFVKPCEEPAESFQAAEEPFHFISLLVQLLVVFPWLPTITFRRDHGDEAKIAHQLARFITLIGSVHDNVRGHRLCALQQRTPFWRIAGIAW